MKKIFLYLPLAVLLVSCIQKEPLNAEADIETCVVLNKEGVRDPNIKGNIIITNDRITALANPKIDLSKLALNITLTKGATISPDPQSLLDYSGPQRFTVTSEDRLWNKEYEVIVDTSEIPVEYSFELSELDGTKTYDVVYEEVKKDDHTFKQYIWASGNPGFALTGIHPREDYPTISVDKGYIGKGIKLETRSTGPFGEMVRMPIAAGNLFIGSFNVLDALKDALKATRFGLPFGKKPISFSGFYKFKKGKIYAEVGTDGKPVPVAGEDVCDIYAVLYRSEGLEGNTLDGANILTHPNIVAIARVKNPRVYPSDKNMDQVDYEEFSAAFEYKELYDQELAKEYKYNLAVVFTSSINGAVFKGAVGSTLYIDEVKVTCE